MRNRFTLFFVGIILLSFILRFYELTNTPVSLSWDEASIAVNAHSINQTGKDEYGSRFPVVFRSFDDYKLPGYIYTVALSQRIFGYNDFSVRFPSALFGVLTVILMYFLTKELLTKDNCHSEFSSESNTLKNKMLKQVQHDGKKLLPAAFYLLPPFLLAISPWHLQFSRAGFEANGSLFFFVAGFVCLLYGRKGKYYIPIGFISFVVSLYFYYSARVLAPALLLIMTVMYWRDYKKYFKIYILSLLLSLVLLVPLISVMFGENAARVTQVSIFNSVEVTIDYVQALARHPDSMLFRVLYNRRIGYIFTFIKNMMLHNSFDFLFVSGDPYPRHHVSNMGLMYLWELPFVLVGIVYFMRKRTKEAVVLLVWWLIGAVPASLTKGSPNALRILTSLPVFILFSAVGVMQVFSYLAKKYIALSKLVFGAIVVGSFVVYLVYYYDFTPPHVRAFWGDGHKQLFTRVALLQDEYDEIHITGSEYKPYVYGLYYLTYNPKRYLDEGGSEFGFDNFVFYASDWDENNISIKEIDPFEVSQESHVLFVYSKEEKRDDLVTTDTIHNTDGEETFYLQKIEKD